MNKAILNSETQKFIKDNLTNDLTKLILKGSPFEEVSVQEIAQQIEGAQKCKKKLPTWYEVEGIIYPKKVNLEQTSSEATAIYKANLIEGNSIIDLTGGFGIDCYYFSKRISKVIHCELNEKLSKIVAHNYQKLNVTNIQTESTDSIEYLKNNKQQLDWIYIDPSRRNDAKGKVFLLDDCLPNVPENLELLFEHSNNILIKNSPILDITSTINELQFVKEIHIIAVQNEVKELLFILEKGFNNNIKIKTINLQKDENQLFEFEIGPHTVAEYQLPLTYLYEPNTAILKSGGFHQLATKLKISKLHQHSHLYTSEDFLENFPGRKFKIEKILNYNKKEILKNLPYKKANITTRNFPETVAQIRKKTKIKDGGNTYLFFTTNLHAEKQVLLCTKM